MTSKIPPTVIGPILDRANSYDFLADRYKGVYDDGPLALRERRLLNLPILVSLTKMLSHTRSRHRLWGLGSGMSSTSKKKTLSSRAMETYAGMVNSIDVNVGRVVEYLKRTGEYDNTFIVFMSDNGAEGAA